MGQGVVGRMKAAKGAILGWLAAAYQRRDQVALVAFQGERADILLHPTSSIFLARQQLRRLPVGGATPFAAGLLQAWNLISAARLKQPGLDALLVILSDGEANVPLMPGADAGAELLELGQRLRKRKLKTLVVDTSSSVLGNEQLRCFAVALGGDYQQIRDLHAGRLVAMIQAQET